MNTHSINSEIGQTRNCDSIRLLESLQLPEGQGLYVLTVNP